MASTRKIVAVILAATIAGVLFIPFNAAVSGNSGTITVDNETVSASVDESVELDGYNIVQDSETIERYNETSDSWDEMVRGTDYEMNNEPGSIDVLDGGSIEDGDELRASYEYEATDTMTTTVVGLLPLFLALLILGSLAGPIMEEM